MEAQNAFLKLGVVVDVTASQDNNVASVKAHLERIITSIVESAKSVVEVALVLYRDHPQNGHNDKFVTMVVPFTRDVQYVISQISEIKAEGGGDLCEAVAHTMNVVLTELDWGIPPDAYEEPTCMVLWITDAPPHGIGGEDDKFPDGCPGHDGVKLSDKFAEKGICVSVAACRNPRCPRIQSPYCPGNAFFRRLTNKTGGTFVNLTEAQQLANVVVAAAVETIELTSLASQVQGMDMKDDQLEAVFRSLSNSSQTLTECDEYINRIDKKASELEAMSCLSPVQDVKTDKEFKEAFRKWYNVNYKPQRIVNPPTMTYDRRYIRQRLDCEEGEAVYRSLGSGALDEEDSDDACYRSVSCVLENEEPMPVSFSPKLTGDMKNLVKNPVARSNKHVLRLLAIHNNIRAKTT